MAIKKRKLTEEQILKALNIKAAKNSLSIAIEWLDKKDTTWAMVNIQQASRLINVVRNM